jgi:N-acetylglucosamine kinase-like BadF-type ATPase
VQDRFDALPQAALGHRRYRCGNDMVCGWAGSLAGQDGINIVAGTGSIGYGERKGIAARCGGWGEIFGDEGSAYWIAVQGLNAFSRMCDGRMPAGPLHRIMKRHFDVSADLDICGRVMGDGEPSRDKIASLSRIFDRAAHELAEIIEAIRVQLGYGNLENVLLSYSGGVFRSGDLVLGPLQRHLSAFSAHYCLANPIFDPSIGAALYAARLCGQPLDQTALAKLPKLAS